MGSEENHCSDCAFWIESEHRGAGFGVCYGAPPAVIVAPLKNPGKIAMAGPVVMAPTNIRPGLPSSERACALFRRRPNNGHIALVETP